MAIHHRTITDAAGAQPIRIRSDGADLAGTLFRPPGRPRAALVIHGATGVPAGFYRAFAAWAAAEQGLAVLTYDYRDFGASAARPVRASRAGMADWGLRDQAAALAALGQLMPNVPRWVLGHSLGGLWFGHHPGMERVERIITLGSGPVHVTDHPPSYRWKARAFWHGPVNWLAGAMGYLPGRLLRTGPDLPLQVYRQWRRWCLTPGWNLCDTGRSLPLPDPHRVRGAMKLIAVSDDAMVPPAAVWRLMAYYPQATKRQQVLRPDDFGLPRIGHIAAFHRDNAVLWPAILA